MAVELVDRLIEDGIAEVKEVYKDEDKRHKLEGALEGFELARALPATYEDFDWAVNQREEEEAQIRREMRDSRTEDAQMAYWRHRWATLQLKYIRNILLVSKFASGEPLPPDTSLSSRAVMRYVSIVGVKDR